MRRRSDQLLEGLIPLAPQQKEDDTYTKEEVALMPFGTLRYQVSGRNALNITVKLAAAVLLAEPRRLLYADFAGSASDIKEIMAAMSDRNAKETWAVSFPGEHTGRVTLPSSFMRVVGTRIKVPGVRTLIHHAAALEPQGLLVLTANRRDLWRRIVASVTTPILDKWRESLMPAVIQNSVVVPCLHFGLPKNIEAWHIDKEATNSMDKIVSAHVRQHQFN